MQTIIHESTHTKLRPMLLAVAALSVTGACAASGGVLHAETPQRAVAERAEREPKSLGAGKELTFSEFRSANERYRVAVKRGQTSELHEAANAYAAYLGAFHRQLHVEYAYRFLHLFGAESFRDRSLSTKIEVVIEQDGSLNRLGVVATSGDEHFDFEAFNAVHRGAPYPPPPAEIRSPDGRTYLRWTLHRDESQCGTWNAEPYILSWVLDPEPSVGQAVEERVDPK